jgi:hypothetical protein
MGSLPSLRLPMKKKSDGGRGGLEPIRARIRYCRAIMSVRAQRLRDIFNIRKQAVNNLYALMANNPVPELVKYKTKERTVSKKSNSARLESMLETCETIINKCYSALEANDWKSTRPSDLLSFMVLAKDIIKDLDAGNKTTESELDAWITSPKKS